MNDLKDSLLIRAITRQPIPRTPVWIMRQAGRYLPEYRQVRQQAGDFLSLCKNPKLACEVTLQPLRRYPLDAAIVFSDILTIPDAMGLGLYFEEGEGPRFKKVVRTLEDVLNLSTSNLKQDLDYVFETVTLVRREMPKALPLIGFSGSPWTLACYMVEGRSSRDFKQILKFLYTEPQAMEALLELLSQAIISYLSSQVLAGANVLMLFDSWGGILTTSNYQQFSLHYMKKIIENLKTNYPDIPIILFTKGGGQWLSDMVKTGCDVLGLDWTTNLGEARKMTNNQVALQGNLDPAVLLTNPNCIRREVDTILKAFGFGSGHIFNLGHGITPDVPPEHVEVLLKAVETISPMYHE